MLSVRENAVLGLKAIYSLGLQGTVTTNGIEITPAKYTEQVNNKIAETIRLDNINTIETLYAKQYNGLVKRTSSTDGVRVRRLTSEGMSTQIKLYTLYQSALALGLEIDGVEALSDVEKSAIAITIAYGTLLSKVCDKTSQLALDGNDEWKVLYNKAKAIKLEPKDINSKTLAKLYKEFGITK